MKKTLTLLIGFTIIALGSEASHATSFSNTVDFSGTGTDGVRTYLSIGDETNNNNFDYNYSHNVEFNPAAVKVNSAQIILSHTQNNDNGTNEIWILFDGTATSIGRLSNSGNSWVDQTFTLSETLFSAISGGTWSFALDLEESTNANDRFWIDKSILSGDYTPDGAPVDSAPVAPVPEPGTMMLLGAGFLGLAIYGKRRKNA